MTDPNIDLYCTTYETACRQAHCIVCRYADDKPIVTVPELLSRRALNGRIAERLTEARAAKPSPIVLGRLGGVA